MISSLSVIFDLKKVSFVITYVQLPYIQFTYVLLTHKYLYSTYILKYSYYLYIVLIYGLYIKSIQKNPPKLNTRCYISIVFPKDALGKLNYIHFFFKTGKKSSHNLSAQPNHFQMRNWESGSLTGLPRLLHSQLVTNSRLNLSILKTYMTIIFTRTSISTKSTCNN